MRRLTEEQRELITKYYYLAEITSRKIKTKLHINERLSAAHDGLVNAAFSWKEWKKATFRTYAIEACRRNILFETTRQKFGLCNRGKIDKPIKFQSTLYHNDRDIPYSDSRLNKLIHDEEIEELYKRVSNCGLTDSQKTILEMYISGMNQVTIANLLGVESQTIQISISRSIRKMKA
jgi:DNA-directed RNA polymerase specialized sigma subunit